MPIFQRLIIVFGLVLPISAAAIVGGERAMQIPSQLCQIVPLLNNQPQAEMSCSAFVIGPHKLRTAGHCGYGFYKDRFEALLVDCLTDIPKVYGKEDIQWTFLDEKGPLNPRLAVTESERVPKDVAIIQLPPTEALAAAPIALMNEGDVAEKIASGQCSLVGTGYNDFMVWGQAHAKKVKAEQFVEHRDHVVALQGKPHVSGHDSGGALVCDRQYAGTIVAQIGQGSLISTNDLATSVDLKACPGDLPSPAIARAFVHLMGFAEVRQYLAVQAKGGLSFCGSGMTLHKNVYQYYKNLIFINLFDSDGQLQKKLTVLLQASSIQGHHSTEGRPWAVLKTSDFNSQAIENLQQELPGSSVVSSPQSVLDLSEVGQLFQASWASMSEVSILNFASYDQKHYFLVTWLKEVTGAGANLYTSQVSPQFALVEKSSAGVVVLKKAGAFNQFLTPAEDLLQEALPSKPLSFDEKIEYIDSLAEL